MAWPGTVDTPTVKVDLVDLVMAADHNTLDTRVIDLQSFFGDGKDELIGNSGAGNGIGGALSGVADGGTAFKLAARAAFTSGKLFSLGENEDVAYAERFAINHAGLVSVSPAGGTNYEDLVVGEDDIPNKKYVDDAVSGVTGYWNKVGTVLSPLIAGDTMHFSPGTGAAPLQVPGIAVVGDPNTGIDAQTADQLDLVLGGEASIFFDKTGARIRLNTQGGSPPIFKLLNDQYGQPIAGDIDFVAKDGDVFPGNDTIYARIEGAALSNAPGSEYGQLNIHLMNNGSLTDTFEFTANRIQSQTPGGFRIVKAMSTEAAPSHSFNNFAGWGLGIYDASEAEWSNAYGSDDGVVISSNAKAVTLFQEISGVPTLSLTRRDAHGSSGANIPVGAVEFWGFHDGSITSPAPVQYAGIQGMVLENFDVEGSEEGVLLFQLMDGGSLTTAAEIVSSSWTFYVGGGAKTTITGAYLQAPSNESYALKHAPDITGAEPTYSYKTATGYGESLYDASDFTPANAYGSDDGLMNSINGVISSVLTMVSNIPGLYLTRRDAHGDDATVGALTFWGMDDAGTPVPTGYAQLLGNCITDGAGNEEGSFRIQVADAGSLADVYSVTSSQHTFSGDDKPTVVITPETGSGDSTICAGIELRGNNDAGSPDSIAYGVIEAYREDESDGTEDGFLIFSSIKAGAKESHVFIGEGLWCGSILTGDPGDGIVRVNQHFEVGTDQVVAARQTGWGAPTGTATRTTFATSTVTVSELAERVHALIDDLISHGLIGA